MNPSDEQVLQAFNQAPGIIQESLSGGSAVDFASTLTHRYDLHIDTAGYVTEFIRNMLLGLLRPEQFIGKLNSIGIADATARKLTSDLNKEVFVPLRDKIRRGENSTPSRTIPQVPVLRVEKETSEGSLSKKSASEAPPYNLIRPAPENPAPALSPTVPAPIQEVSAPVPTMRTMQHDMELVQHGSMPAPYPVAPAQLHPAQATPARTFQTASVPVNVPSVRPQPLPEIVHIVPDTARQPAPQAPQVPSSREYTADPYRETI